MEEERLTLLGEKPRATSDGSKATGTSPLQVYLTFVNGFVGGGLLGLPYGFMNGGLIASGIGLIIISILSNFTLRLLITCKTKFHDSPLSKESTYSINDETRLEGPQSYADIGRICFGRTGIIMVNASVLVSQLGYCCAYLVFIALNIKSLSFIPSHEWGLHNIHILLAVLPFLVLLVWLRDLSKLSAGTLISNVAIVLAVAAVLEYGFQKVGIRSISDYKMINVESYAIFYGIVAFSFTIHGLVFDIHKTMKEPSKFYKSMDAAMVFVTVAYNGFGALAYLFFGKDTNSVITINLGVNIESDVIKIALSIILMFAYPLQMFPAMNILEGAIFKKEETMVDGMKRNAFRLLVVVLTICAAVAVPLFGLFASLVGTFSNSFIAFIYPPLFYMKMFRNSVPLWQKIVCGIVFIFGLIGMGVGSSITLYDIVKAL